MSCSSPTTHAAVRRRASTRSRRPGTRRLAAVLGAGVLVAGSAVLAAGPAAAHDNLTGSTPVDGSTVTTPPERVRLAFSEQVQDIGLTVLVKDPSGGSVTDGAPTIDGRTVVQPLTELTATGVYTVAYRVVSSDGHPISGRLTFAVDLASASPSPTASASAPVSPSPAPTSSAPEPSASAVAATPAASTSGTGSATGWFLAGAGLLAALVVVGVVLARRRAA